MVLPASHRVPRVPWYSGTRPKKTLSFRLRGYHPLWHRFPTTSTMKGFCNFPRSPQPPPAWSHNPECATPTGLNTHSVWAVPISLAATLGIAFAFSSWGYLDVSVPPVRPPTLCIQVGVSCFLQDGLPHSGISGSKLVRQLTEAYRSLPRLSSPPGAKASTVRP